MENVFGTPKDAIHIYRNDNSGVAPNPIPGTNVKHRVFYHQHLSAHRFLTGHNLKRMTERFVDFLSEECYQDRSIGEDWIDMPDLFDFWKTRVLCAAVKALFGTWILKLNPSFQEDFWTYVNATPTLMKGIPRFLAPGAYAARDRVFESIKIWHRYASEHSDYKDNGPESKEWDEYWGSSWLKVRQQFARNTGEMSEDAIAAEDTALLFSANANAIFSAIWFLLAIYTDPALEKMVNYEVQNSITQDTAGANKPLALDITGIIDSPLLQSIYAEVLRMRVALVLNRTPDKADYELGGWKFRKGRSITFSTQVAAHNEKAWSVDKPQRVQRPLSQFWAERFLTSTGNGSAEKQFSTDGLAGAWIPYGGGVFMCPGRHFAKQEIMGSVAAFSAYYDLLIPNREAGWMPKEDKRFYGLGAMPPGEKIRFRIRKKSGAPMGPPKHKNSRLRGNWFCD
ncbi:cytochrome P450 [Pseudovirgaria hyperparasitica]|uniref:Cytochrome P450 n=1 Tax=Pseudovirgaria hyperparasitica TaxID=470096 RepID=A0A6A6VTF8_9PEZI|nr:cytochrome P450 [Pseudovirgaria hyperparasitica]KAF2753076.1 cytochrome P450 [Pseudovirgaria hyperparasitica]